MATEISPIIRSARRTARVLLRLLFARGSLRRAAYRILSPLPKGEHRFATIIGADRPELSLRVATGPLRGSRFVQLLPAELISLDEGVMERANSEFVAALSLDGACVIDLGASYGYYAVLFSRLVGPAGHVWAFEPNPLEHQRLRANVYANVCRNVSTVPIAISDRAALARFQSDPSRPWLGRLDTDTERTWHAPTVVATASLDEFVAEAALAPTLVKIDVEGAEVSVLAGCRNLIQKSAPMFLIEAHSEESAVAVQRHLVAAGYTETVIEIASPVRQHLFFSRPTRQ